VTTWGAVEDRIMPEGLSFKTPIAQGVTLMEVRTQKFSSAESSASKDLQTVTTEVTVNYRLDASKVNKIYQELSLDYEDRVILPAIKEAVKASTAKFNAEELINKRDLVKTEIESALKTRVEQFGGIIIQAVSITDFSFSPEFDQAIEQKVTAEQEALKAKNVLEKIKIEAQQKIAIAQAEAESIRIQGDALKNNPTLLTLRQIEMLRDTWDGHYPTFVSGDSSNFLLGLDMNELSA
jgi:regulator of protease activity HflC (stomatin/prohibitin superfamily)